MSHDHTYATTLAWSGSTAVGYRSYDRAHRLSIAGATLELSADPAFRGDPALPNPEQLLLAAASSCQLLSFLALAAAAGLDVTAYDDDAEALLAAAGPPADSADRPDLPDRPDTAERRRISRIVLRPRVCVAAGTDADRVLTLLQTAHEQCYIANTLNAEVVLEITVVTA